MPKAIPLLILLPLTMAISGCGNKAEKQEPSPPSEARPSGDDSQTVPTTAPEVDAEKLLTEAKAAKHSKDPQRALELVNQVCKAQPANVEANWLKAWLLAGVGQADAAVEQFQHVLTLDLDGERKKQAEGALARLREKAGSQTSVAGATPQRTPAATASPANWPGWRGPNRNGKSSDTGLLRQWPEGGPQKLWQATGLGKGFSSVAVTGGAVYTAGDVGGKMHVFAFDMTGKPKWKIAHDSAWTTNHPGARSTPVIDGGKLYLISGHGLVGCYNAANGKRIWTRKMSELGGSPPNWGYAESVLIHGNHAIVTPGGSQCVAALDKNTGRTVWTSTGFTAGAQYGSCIVASSRGVTMIVAGTDKGLVAVDARNGKLLWQNGHAAGNTANCPTPVYADGYVFWAVGYGKGGVCMKLNGAKAKQAWTTSDMVCHHGGYIVNDGYLYGNNGGAWACLDLKTGEKKWQERGVGKGSLCYADGRLYLFSERGGKAGLATCAPDGMQMVGHVQVPGRDQSWAHPVVTGGRLYLRYEDNLCCFDVRAG